MIFEKAWAKLHLSYEATAGGLTDDAASYLSGGVLKSLKLARGDDNSDVWVECMESLNPTDGNSFTFLSCAVRGDEDPSDLGLITGHAYSILKMVLTPDGKRFVQIRNPWGQHEWNGRFSDKSSLWTDRLKAAVGFEDEVNGRAGGGLRGLHGFKASADSCLPVRTTGLSSCCGRTSFRGSKASVSVRDSLP